MYRPTQRVYLSVSIFHNSSSVIRRNTSSALEMGHVDPILRPRCQNGQPTRPVPRPFSTRFPDLLLSDHNPSVVEISNLRALLDEEERSLRHREEIAVLEQQLAILKQRALLLKAMSNSNDYRYSLHIGLRLKGEFPDAPTYRKSVVGGGTSRSGFLALWSSTSVEFAGQQHEIEAPLVMHLANSKNHPLNI
ncbi:hypothetical protein PM082_021728 [Marasmius tenuissimus]|nr:hypothetical protein PM082_021728 [Marasmius tenuissimus]